MAAAYILAYDLGTGGVKTALFDAAGTQRDTLFAEYATRSVQESWAEQDPETWWSAFCSSTRSLLEKNRIGPGNLAAVSFSGQMMACLPVDRQGRALAPCIIWADRRSLPQARELARRVEEQTYYRLTGNKIYPTYPLPKFMWLKENLPDVYAKTYRFLQPKDYLIHKLTGVFVTDYSDASTTAALDMRTRTWSEEALRLAGIDVAKMPEIHASTDVVGKVTSEASGASGLPEGLPVVMGAGDGPCANLGCGVFREGSAYVYLGTSSWVSSASRKIVCDPGMALFNVCAADPGLINVFGTMQMGGGSFQWLKNTVCAIERQMASLTGDSPYELMTRQAAASPPGAGNLLFLPYLRGERSPRWNPAARGAFIGLTAGHGRGDLIRSVMEGVIFNLKIIREALKGEDATIREMRAVGGGAESPLWRQILADIFGEAVHVPTLLEAANPLGAAVIGGVGVGLFADFGIVDRLNPIVRVQTPSEDPVIRERYARLFEVFEQAYQALLPVFDALS
jgi:xylulokinase